VGGWVGGWVGGSGVLFSVGVCVCVCVCDLLIFLPGHEDQVSRQIDDHRRGHRK